MDNPVRLFCMLSVIPAEVAGVYGNLYMFPDFRTHPASHQPDKVRLSQHPSFTFQDPKCYDPVTWPSFAPADGHVPSEQVADSIVTPGRLPSGQTTEFVAIRT
jgi:hypothetical protein